MHSNGNKGFTALNKTYIRVTISRKIQFSEQNTT